jgi:type VI secretion system protein ImpF
MPRLEADQELLASVLDRLIDDEPGNSSEAAQRGMALLAEIKASVRRDLEWLLNARQPIFEVPLGEAQRLLRTSVLTFGLPDFSDATLSRLGEQHELRQIIQDRISRFEPRLNSVIVTLIEGNQLDRRLDFRIDAILEVEPVREPVSFDSILELTTKVFAVKGG